MTVQASAATDVEAFARSILGRPLWDHQVSVARSRARYRIICAGRQVGKSTLLAVLALFEAATRSDVLILLVSAGEVASRRLLEECAALATRSALTSGVLDESKSLLRLSNGSRIISVPASSRQIRGWPVDVLIIDEAGFVDQDVWRSSEPAVIARPGSKVILSSSPWGGHDHFFRSLWNRGMDHPDLEVAAWHWPSIVSPLVDKHLLEQIRQREPQDYFEREFLARWTDSSGAFFSERDLMGAVADYQMTPPEEVANHVGSYQPRPTVSGIDWGVSRDANALALVGLVDPERSADRRWRFFVPWLRAEYSWQWEEFISYIVKTCRSYDTRMVASERNGVGSWPTDDLANRLLSTGCWVRPVWTDIRRKQAGFSKIKALLQSDRLILPNHPELLKQLRALEFEQSDAGAMKISVPERAGHDDLAMALLQAVSAADPRLLNDLPLPLGADVRDLENTVMTATGVAIPRRPIPAHYDGWITSPKGKETGHGW